MGIRESDLRISVNFDPLGLSKIRSLLSSKAYA